MILVKVSVKDQFRGTPDVADLALSSGYNGQEFVLASIEP
jgi:hypothetical protein